MSCGDYELQNFFQLISWCLVMVQGSLLEHQFLLLSKDSFSLLSICIISQQVFQILHFPVRDSLDCGLKYWIFLLGSHPFSHMEVHMHFSGSSQNCSFPDLLMYFLSASATARS